MRLIDADVLIEDINSFWDWDSIDGITSTTVLKQTITDISHALTIDAVPVVRCKDCKYYDTPKNSKKPYCMRGAYVKVNADDYCSKGERK